MEPPPSLAQLSPTRRALVADALERRRALTGTQGPRPRDRSEAAPLSFSQLRIWFLQQWDPTAPTFNAARAFRLSGELRIDPLRRGVWTLVERHESLRTVFRAAGAGEPRQIVLQPSEVEMPVLDISSVPLSERTERLGTLMRELSRQPFDLAVDPMLRATLIRLAPDEHVLLLRIHHIAADAHSTGVMFRELATLYNAGRAGLPHGLSDPPIQFADFAVWQRERLRGSLLASLTEYWVNQLEGAPPLLALPTDRSRRRVQRHDGAHIHFELTDVVAEGIDALARAERATMYMVTLAAFATMLYRLGGEDDLVVGSPIANRTHAELAEVIGFISNTVALRVRLNGNPSFREAVRRTRAVALGALAHQEMPFEQVVSALRLSRDAGHNPIFQANFRAQATPPPVPDMTGLSVDPVRVDIGYSRFDLAFELQSGPNGLLGYCEYDLDLFEDVSIGRFIDSYRALLHQALADPDMPILAITLPPSDRSHSASAGRARSPRGRRRTVTERDQA